MVRTSKIDFFLAKIEDFFERKTFYKENFKSYMYVTYYKVLGNT